MKKIFLIKYLFIALVLSISSISYFEKFGTGGFTNFGFYVVTSGSMAPEINKGDVVITSPTTIENIKVGDIITFDSPLDIGKTVTHRVVEIEYSDGNELFLTQGDSNNSVDPWYLKNEMLRGQLAFTIPWIGFVISFLRSPLGWFLFIILPVGYLILKELEVLSLVVGDSIKNKKFRMFFRSADSLIGAIKQKSASN